MVTQASEGGFPAGSSGRVVPGSARG